MVAIVASQLADLFTFLLVVRIRGVDGEANGLASWVYGEAGPIGIILLKLLALTLVLVVFGKAKSSVVKTAVVFLAVLFGLLGAATNTVAGVMS